jgi:hypothetical protein
LPSAAARDLRGVRNPTLERFLAAPGRFALAGAGPAGEALLAALARLGLKPHALLDSDRTGRTGELRGLEILAPEQAVEVALDAVVTAGPFARDMTAQLRAEGFEGRVLDLSGLAQGRFAGHHDLPSLDAAADAIEFARSLLSDDGSRDLFDSVLAYRRSLDPGDLPPASPPFFHPAVAVTAGDQAIEVGAGDPEATLACAEAVGPLGRVHVFEPREEPRSALLEALADSPVGGRVSVHRAACGRSGSPRAARGGEEGSGRAVGLDEFVWEELGGRVDWIRLSAGSAQGEVLQGAAASLGQRRPRLAVDLHGRPEDLWQLPIRLRERVPAYRLHLGHHSQGLSDTVCYARAAR